MGAHNLNLKVIESVVTAFYRKATTDFLIGYQFRKIATQKGDHPLLPPFEAFSHHIPRIIAFWELQLLGKTNFPFEEFKLFPVHEALHIKRGELDRWLLLFRETINEIEMDSEFKELWLKKLSNFENKFKSYFFDS
ncbi:MAG: hypothetical protein Fur0010_25840 [Bdellovibrio sp.]